MLRPTLLSLATLALLSLPAAADGDPLADLIGTSWQLTELGGAASAADVTSTLMFSADSVNGNGGCNSYGGKLEPTPNGIAISQTFSTMMACPGLDQEQAFFAALEATKNFAITGGKLQLLDDGATVLAEFTPAS
ncbi:META domain-containing protein [Devosia sp. A369]